MAKPSSGPRRGTDSGRASRCEASTAYMPYVGVGTSEPLPGARNVLAMMSSTSSAPQPTRIWEGSAPTYAAAASASSAYVESGYSLRPGSQGPASASSTRAGGAGEVFVSKRRISVAASP